MYVLTKGITTQYKATPSPGHLCAIFRPGNCKARSRRRPVFGIAFVNQSAFSFAAVDEESEQSAPHLIRMHPRSENTYKHRLQNRNSRSLVRNCTEEQQSEGKLARASTLVDAKLMRRPQLRRKHFKTTLKFFNHRIS